MKKLFQNLASRNSYATEKSPTRPNTSFHLSTTKTLRPAQNTNSTNTEPTDTLLATENDHRIENQPLGNCETSTPSSADAETLSENDSEREMVCIEDHTNKSNQLSTKPTDDPIIISMRVLDVNAIDKSTNKTNSSSLCQRKDDNLTFDKMKTDNIRISADVEVLADLADSTFSTIQEAVDKIIHSECMNDNPSPNDSKSITITELKNELSNKTIATVSKFCEIRDTTSSTNQMEADIVVDNEPTVQENIHVNEKFVDACNSISSLTTVSSDSIPDKMDSDLNNFSSPQITTELTCEKMETNNAGDFRGTNFKNREVLEMIVDCECTDDNPIVSRPTLTTVSSEVEESSDVEDSHTITEFQNQSLIEKCIAEAEVDTIKTVVTISGEQITEMLDIRTNSNNNSETLLIVEPSFNKELVTDNRDEGTRALETDEAGSITLEHIHVIRQNEEKILGNEIVIENLMKIPDVNFEEKFRESDNDLSEILLQDQPKYFYQLEYYNTSKDDNSSENCKESDQDDINLYQIMVPEGFTSGFNNLDDKYFIIVITTNKLDAGTSKGNKIARLTYPFRDELKFEIEKKDQSDYILYTITDGGTQKFTGSASGLKLHLLELCKSSEKCDESFCIIVFLAQINFDHGCIHSNIRCNQYPEILSSDVEEKSASRIYNINKILNAVNPEQIILINSQNENLKDEVNISNVFRINNVIDCAEIISPEYEHINVQKEDYDKKVLELPVITVVNTIDLNERDKENVTDSIPINCVTDYAVQTTAKNELLNIETEKCIMSVDENPVNTNGESGELDENQTSFCSTSNSKNEKCIFNSISLHSAIEIDESPRIERVNGQKRKSNSRAVRIPPKISSIKTDMYDEISSDEMSPSSDNEIENTNASVIPDCNVKTTLFGKNKSPIALITPTADIVHKKKIRKNLIQTNSKIINKRKTMKKNNESSKSFIKNNKMNGKKRIKKLTATQAVIAEGCMSDKLLLNTTNTVSDAVGDMKNEKSQTVLPLNNTNSFNTNSSNANDEVGTIFCTAEILNLNPIKEQSKTESGKSPFEIPSNDNLYVDSSSDFDMIRDSDPMLMEEEIEEFFAGDKDDRNLSTKSASVGNTDEKEPAKEVMEFTRVDDLSMEEDIRNNINSETDNGTALQEIAKQKFVNNVIKSSILGTNQRTESTTAPQISSSIEIVEMNNNYKNSVEEIQSPKNSSVKEKCIASTLPCVDSKSKIDSFTTEVLQEEKLHIDNITLNESNGPKQSQFVSNNAPENSNQAAVTKLTNERELDGTCNSEIARSERIVTDYFEHPKGDKTCTDPDLEDPCENKESEMEKIFRVNTSDALVNSTDTAEDIIEQHSVLQFEIESNYYDKGDSGIVSTASVVFEESMETNEDPGKITSYYEVLGCDELVDEETQTLSSDTKNIFIEPLISIDKIKVEKIYDCDRPVNFDQLDSFENANNEEFLKIIPPSNDFIRTTETNHVTQNEVIPVAFGDGAPTNQAVVKGEQKIEQKQRIDIDNDEEIFEPSNNGIPDASLTNSKNSVPDENNTASVAEAGIIHFGQFIEPNTSFNEAINLTPWLKTKVLKNKVNAMHMLRKEKLQHLFKCVEPECSFTTNRSSEMVQHLNYHDEYTTCDSRLYRKCAYCSVSIPNASYLVSHITDEHGKSRYQCLYCFYRSCAHVNVISHQKIHHQALPFAVLICLGSEPDGVTIREDIERNRKKFVLPFVCSGIKTPIFYLTWILSILAPMCFLSNLNNCGFPL